MGCGWVVAVVVCVMNADVTGGAGSVSFQAEAMGVV